jgi:AcrR family transcriptional regulator
MGHQERRHKEKEEIKQRILEAACQIADQEGWSSLTIRKIADKIEYTPPIVYEYFESKEDLIREIVYSGFSKLNNLTLVVLKSETNPKELIKRISMVQWDFAFENTKLYQLMFSLEKPIPDEEMMEIMKKIAGVFQALISDKDSLHEIIFSWMCLMTGAISMYMKFPNLPHHGNKSMREIYASIISRFVERL